MRNAWDRLIAWFDQQPRWAKPFIAVAGLSLTIVAAPLLLAWWLARRDGSRILSRAIPAVLALAWVIVWIPVLSWGAADDQPDTSVLSNRLVSEDLIPPDDESTTSSPTSTTTSPPTTAKATTTTRITTTTTAPTTTTTQQPTTTTAPSSTTVDPRQGCDPAYPTVCIPPKPPDLDCGEISFRRFEVLAPDPHGFDGDNDGVGCESG